MLRLSSVFLDLGLQGRLVVPRLCLNLSGQHAPPPAPIARGTRDRNQAIKVGGGEEKRALEPLEAAALRYSHGTDTALSSSFPNGEGQRQ